MVTKFPKPAPSCTFKSARRFSPYLAPYFKTSTNWYKL
jgi:hypothetical protein